MAGTSHPGATIDISLGFDFGAPYIGNADGGGIPWNQWTGGHPGAHEPFALLAAVGAATASGGGGTKVTPVARTGIDEADRTSFAYDWFERVHVIPRVKIEFGNIITLEQEDYELYNAFRDTTVTLTSILNNVAPGVELPNLAAPASQGHLSSWLDPTSTDNSGGTGLGTLVLLKVQALADGLPLFDGNIVFGFDVADSVEMTLSGQRIVLMPMEYEAPVKETLAFLTDIIEGLDGTEQRIALRDNPRQLFEVRYLLDGNDRQRMQALLMDWTDNAFGFPLWHEKLRLAAAVSAGATSYQVQGADEVDLRDGGLAVVFTDANTFDVINITGLTSTTITANDPSVNAYPAGTTIMPLRTAIIRRAVGGRRYRNNLEEFRVQFEVVDNDTGVLTGDVSAYGAYNGRVLFDDCNVVSGETMPEEFRRRVYVTDNDTGVVTVASLWDRGKRASQKGFVLRDRAEILAFRRMLLSVRGRQKAFYLPTAIEDVEVKATLGIGTATMDIENVEYERFVQTRLPRTICRVTFTDGTSLERVVQSVAGVDATTERLTMDTTWPSTRTVDEVARVEFYELSRFDVDGFNIEYPRIGLARCTAPVLQVFDDNA